MRVNEGMEQKYIDYVAKNLDDYGNTVVRRGEAFAALLDHGVTDFDWAMKATATAGNNLSGEQAAYMITSIVEYHPRGKEVEEWRRRVEGK